MAPSLGQLVANIMVEAVINLCQESGDTMVECLKEITIPRNDILVTKWIINAGRYEFPR